MARYNKFEGCEKAKFWARLDRRDDGCWTWPGSRTAKGYGTAYYGGRNVLAHRLAHTLANGEIPVGMVVCHSCDTPSCCNPDHLWIGTASDNIRDCVAKGRQNHPRGETVHRARLTEQAVRDIRAATGTLRELGERFRIAPTQIGKIKRREAWAHVSD